MKKYKVRRPTSKNHSLVLFLVPIFLLAFFNPVLRAEERRVKVCATLKRSLTVRDRATRKRLSFYRGEIFAIQQVERSSSRVRLEFGQGLGLWMNKKLFQIEPSDSCSEGGEKAFLENDILGQSFELLEGQKYDVKAMVPKGVYQVISVFNYQGQKLLRVLANNEQYFVPSTQVTFDYSVDKERLAKKGIYSFLGFPVVLTGSYHFGLPADEYQSMITNVPDPSDVSPLQDPLIRSIDDGQGYSLGVLT